MSRPIRCNPNLIYGGNVTRLRSQPLGQYQDVAPVVLRTGNFRFVRTAPVLFSPVDPHILYLGSNVLFKTADGGNSWEIISPDLSREDPGVPESLGVFIDSRSREGQAPRRDLFASRRPPKMST